MGRGSCPAVPWWGRHGLRCPDDGRGVVDHGAKSWQGHRVWWCPEPAVWSRRRSGPWRAPVVRARHRRPALVLGCAGPVRVRCRPRRPVRGDGPWGRWRVSRSFAPRPRSCSCGRRSSWWARVSFHWWGRYRAKRRALRRVKGLAPGKYVHIKALHWHDEGDNRPYEPFGAVPPRPFP